MLNFKPSNPPGDSSEDLEDMVGNSDESEESDVSDDIDAAEEITDVGEESGEPNKPHSRVWILACCNCVKKIITSTKMLRFSKSRSHFKGEIYALMMDIY